MGAFAIDTSINEATPSTSLEHYISSLPSPTALPSTTPTPYSSSLSSSAALGIGFAAGAISVIILLTAGLFIHRCWKVRQSPTVQYYEQARLWKGFTPATPNTARTTLIESKMANIYFTDLRSPAIPAYTVSPPLRGQEQATPSPHRSRSSELPI
jgi:hypothetical protein